MCSQNRLRSPTAQSVFSGHPQVSALSAGTNKDSETPVSGDLIEWADVIFVMEKVHKNRISKRFRELVYGKRVVVLGIQDVYEYMDSHLVKILKLRVSRLLGVEEPK